MGKLIVEGDHLELDGSLLQAGDQVEICLIGSFIPGMIAHNQWGWYFLTRHQVGIRLQTGLAFSPALVVIAKGALMKNSIVARIIGVIIECPECGGSCINGQGSFAIEEGDNTVTCETCGKEYAVPLYAFQVRRRACSQRSKNTTYSNSEEHIQSTDTAYPTTA